MLNINNNNIMVVQKFCIIILFNCFLLSNNKTLSPILKSAVLPGLGQLELGETKRSKIFLLLEVTLLTTCLGTYYFTDKQIKNYKSFSADHAGVNIRNKNHKYWVDIGNYIDYRVYNQEHLRFRESGDLYLPDQEWSWDLDMNRKKFKKMRINADIFKRRTNFIIGSIMINHIVSSIDVHYLKRVGNNTSLYVNPVSKDINFKYEF